jgi:hypothetical protein
VKHIRRFTGNLTVKQQLHYPCRVMTDFEEGFLLGVLVGEGHFGGDGRQPQVTLRMHVRHEELFQWLVGVVPDSRLYGPYHHGGRSYYQWMARGKTLRERVLPVLFRHFDKMDGHTRERIEEMASRYSLAERIDGQWRILEPLRAEPKRSKR